VYENVERDTIPSAVRTHAHTYGLILNDTDPTVLRAHPRAEVWSALEYACHMRDVFRVQRERVLLSLIEDQPAFVSMRREERVVEERYNEQRPAVVAGEITEAAEAFAETLEGLGDDAWRRTGVYNYPATRVRTVEWIGRHTVHECEHHLQDIEGLVASSPGG